MVIKKGSSGIFGFLISLIGIFVMSLAIPQTGLGLTLYDDFSSPTINSGKWLHALAFTRSNVVRLKYTIYKPVRYSFLDPYQNVVLDIRYTTYDMLFVVLPLEPCFYRFTASSPFSRR